LKVVRTVIPTHCLLGICRSRSSNTAFPLEPNQVIYEDFAPVVQFSNYDGYVDLARVTQALFQPKIKVTPNIQRFADTITADRQTQREKAQRLYDWVSKNIRYVVIDAGASGLQSKLWFTHPFPRRGNTVQNKF
jgi:transglutaminase-like putative cysteine protease